MRLSKLIEITDLRMVWKHEATDFTKWLASDENISILGDELGLSLIEIETEKAVGAYRLDIFAKDDESRTNVAIENQLEDTNHDHLGKIITYASGVEAKKIIWIVKDIREEHYAAINWLNENTNNEISFFLIKIKLFQIDNSSPAPKFEVICKPDNWSKNIKAENTKQLLEREKLRLEFWQGLIDFNDSPHSHRKSSRNHWLDCRFGHPMLTGCLLTSKMNPKGAAVEMGVNNLYYCDSILENKSNIEAELGFNIDIIKRSRSFIITTSYKYSINNQDRWSEIYQWYLITFEKMKDILPKYFE
jgi:hypothetical protein